MIAVDSRCQRLFLKGSLASLVFPEHLPAARALALSAVEGKSRVAQPTGPLSTLTISPADFADQRRKQAGRLSHSNHRSHRLTQIKMGRMMILSLINFLCGWCSGVMVRKTTKPLRALGNTKLEGQIFLVLLCVLSALVLDLSNREEPLAKYPTSIVFRNFNAKPAQGLSLLLNKPYSNPDSHSCF